MKVQVYILFLNRGVATHKVSLLSHLAQVLGGYIGEDLPHKKHFWHSEYDIPKRLTLNKACCIHIAGRKEEWCLAKVNQIHFQKKYFSHLFIFLRVTWSRLKPHETRKDTNNWTITNTKQNGSYWKHSSLSWVKEGLFCQDLGGTKMMDSNNQIFTGERLCLCIRTVIVQAIKTSRMQWTVRNSAFGNQAELRRLRRVGFHMFFCFFFNLYREH